MSARSLRFAVVGCGSIGQRRLRTLAELGCGDLIAVDPDAERRERAAAAVGARPLPDLAAALAAGAGVVFVAAPSALHLELAGQAVDAGAHLLVEKPLAHRLEGAAELVERFERSGRVGLLGMNWKFHPTFRRIKALLDEGALGRVFAARLEFGQYLPDWHPWEDYRRGYSARRDLGGGILLDAHEFEYARWFLGDVDGAFGLVDHTGLLEIDTEDSVSALLRFASGASGEVRVDYLQRGYGRNLAFHGAEGSIGWNAHDGAVVVAGPAAERLGPSWSPPEGYGVADTYVDEVRHFLDCLDGKAAPRTTLRDGLETLRLVEAVRRSSETGRLEAVR